MDDRLPEERDEETLMSGGAGSSRGGANNLIPQAAEAQQRVERILVELRDPDASFQQRLDKLVEVQSLIMPQLVAEIFATRPNVGRSVIISRTAMAIRDISNMIIKKREAEVADDLNPYSPKFQASFGWIIELFYMVVAKQGLDQIQISNLFNDLATELVGWEDKLDKRLKGVSSKALDQLNNPFLDDFKQKTQAGSTIDVPPAD